MTTPSTSFSSSLTASNQFGTFFGVPQNVFDRVWDNLSNSSNSVAYISMEIGADPDVYNPVGDYLRKQLSDSKGYESNDSLINQYLHNPQKIPTYSGGLGILAGDTLKSYADCRLPVVAVSLLYREGYFSQIVDYQLGQISQRVNWRPEDVPGLYLLQDPAKPDAPLTVDIPFFTKGDRELYISAHVWMKMEINRNLDYFVPEILLDFSIGDAPERIKASATKLYNSESSITKAIQRRLLGVGILPALKALGLSPRTFHLNEQHGVVLAMQLIAEKLHGTMASRQLNEFAPEIISNAATAVAEDLVYTIHTPVKAGHDRFNKKLYGEICSSTCRRVLDILAYDEEYPDDYNFTNMAMRVNRSANSVSRLHRDVTHKQFPQFAEKISAITNGVHHLTWISDERASVFDSFSCLDSWRRDPGMFKEVRLLLSDSSFRKALQKAWVRDTDTLITYVNSMLLNHRLQMTKTWIDPPNFFSYMGEEFKELSGDVFTVGFARRFSTYKRADLIFYDMDMLCKTIIDCGKPINFLFAGKAHPADEPGKTVLKSLLNRQEELHCKSNGLASLVFIPGYDMEIAKMLVAGVHAWLNCPKRPLEASGTSGMKAAMNGVPNISIMDGWWVEGYHNGSTGWKFGHEGPIDSASLNESREELLYFEDSSSFYRLLPKILHEFYSADTDGAFMDKSIRNLYKNIPIFNTHRMAAEYLDRYKVELPKKQMAEMAGYAKLYSSDK